MSVGALISAGRFREALKDVEQGAALPGAITAATLAALVARMDGQKVEDEDFAARLTAVNDVLTRHPASTGLPRKLRFAESLNAGWLVQFAMPVSATQAAMLDFAIADALTERFPDTLARFASVTVIPDGDQAR